MDSKVSAPRITAPYLDSFNGRHVTLVGKVTQLRGDQAIVDSDGAVTLILNRVSRSLFRLHLVLHPCFLVLSCLVLSCFIMPPHLTYYSTLYSFSPRLMLTII